MSNKFFIISLVIFGLIFICFRGVIDYADADSLIIENKYGRFEIYPLTSNNIITQMQYCNFTSYINDCEIDVAFRFDRPISNPKIWIWENISHDILIEDYDFIQDSYILYNIDNFNFMDQPDFVRFGDIPSDKYANGTATDELGNPYGYIDIGFDSFQWLNPEQTNAIFYYEYWGKTGEHIEQVYYSDWKNINDKFNHVMYNDYHYYYIREWVIKDKEYKFKWEYNIKIGTSGKWDLIAKKSSDPLNRTRVIIDPWWDSNWNNSKTITINSSYIDSNLQNFPVLINNTNTTLISRCDDGKSIRFVSLDNTTEFKYEIGHWSDIGFNIWVNISETVTSGSDYKFQMYYNNSVCGGNENPEDVWDSDYLAVWHLRNLTDSTSNSYDLSSTADSGYDGKIGDCYNFVAVDLDEMTNSDILNSFPDEITLEAWVKRDAIGSWDEIISKWNDNSINRMVFVLKNTNQLRIFGGDDEASYDESTTGTINTFFNYIAMGGTDGSDLILYINDTEVDDSGTWHKSDDKSGTGSDLHLGIRYNNGNPFDGLLDEVRISKTQRSNAWIKACFHTQNQSHEFLIFGEEQAYVYIADLEISNVTPANDSYYCNSIINLTHISAHIENPYGYNFNVNITFLNISYIWSNVGNDTYSVNITTLIPIGTTNYTWHLNITTVVCIEMCYYDADYYFNVCWEALIYMQVSAINVTGASGNVTTDEILTEIQSDFAFETETIGLIIFALLWFFAEKKNDIIYFLFIAVLGLPLGVYLISTVTLFDVFLGVAVILLSVYFFFLFLYYSLLISITQVFRKN